MTRNIQKNLVQELAIIFCFSLWHSRNTKGDCLPLVNTSVTWQTVREFLMWQNLSCYLTRVEASHVCRAQLLMIQCSITKRHRHSDGRTEADTWYLEVCRTYHRTGWFSLSLLIFLLVLFMLQFLWVRQNYDKYLYICI